MLACERSSRIRGTIAAKYPALRAGKSLKSPAAFGSDEETWYG
jgi:hypothetical protein